MRIRLWMIGLLIFSLMGCQKDSWQKFSSEEGAFSIKLPGAPLEQVATVDTDAGPVEFHLFILDTFGRDGIAYTVAYSDYPDSVMQAGAPDSIFNEVRDRALAKLQGELTSDLEVTLGEHPGREIRIQTTDGEFYIDFHLYMVGTRFYQVIVETHRDKSTSPEIQKCFDSFKLIET